MRRVRRIFNSFMSYAREKLPWLKVHRVHACKMADAEHRKSWRQFAHQGHLKNTVCFARAAEKDLSDMELIGLSVHELGHVVADAIGLPAHRRPAKPGRTPKDVQNEADEVAAFILKIPLRYNKRRIQEPRIQIKI